MYVTPDVSIDDLSLSQIMKRWKTACRLTITVLRIGRIMAKRSFYDSFFLYACDTFTLKCVFMWILNESYYNSCLSTRVQEQGVK